MNKQRHQVHLSVLDKKKKKTTTEGFYTCGQYSSSQPYGWRGCRFHRTEVSASVPFQGRVHQGIQRKAKKKKCIYFLLVPTEHDQGVRWLFQESKHFMMASLSNLKLRKDLEERCSQLLLQTTCCPLVELHVSDGSAASYIPSTVLEPSVHPPHWAARMDND